MSKLNAVVIGCGNIGAKFDFEPLDAQFPLTHSAAFSRDPRFSLLACVDPNEDNLRATQRHFAPQYLFTDLDKLVQLAEPIHIVSLCSPTDLHHSNLLKIIKLRPKLIFCEKPVTPTVHNSLSITKKLKSENIQMVVNYSRRWDPSVIDLRQKILTSEFGVLRAVSGVYNKGILNNGSHMLNMLSFLLGDLRIVAVGEPFDITESGDPTMPAILKDEREVPITLSPTAASDYSHFECSFAFSGAMVTMREGGAYWETRQKTNSRYFADYTVLGESVLTSGRYFESMTQALDNIYRHVVNDEPIINDAHSAIQTQILCEQLVKLSNKLGNARRNTQ